MYILVCYIGHLAISLIATVWVAQTLVRNGRTFLIDAFHGNVELADSVNHLLVVGFYLINVGYVIRALRTSDQVTTGRSPIELVCDKIRLRLNGSLSDTLSQPRRLPSLAEERAGGSAAAASAGRADPGSAGGLMHPVTSLTIVNDASCRLCTV